MSLRLPGFWHELTSPDFARLDPEATLAVLPVGAIEQHGPHLPVAVDTCLLDAVVARALALLPEGAPVLVLPTSAVGKSNEHVDFPGTLTLSAATLGRVWYELGCSVRRAGLRKLLLVNSHGGQPQVMQIVARELRIDHGMLAVAANWFSWGLPEGLFDAGEIRHGIHGGAIETAMMLAVRPDLVDTEAAADFVPVTVADDLDYPRLRALGPAGLGWQAQDLHRQGVCGDATAATAAAGQAVLDHAAACLAELMQELVRFPLARLVER
ncbi:MAG: creatininase family protein [Geminicoccaceae bacterium]